MESILYHVTKTVQFWKCVVMNTEKGLGTRLLFRFFGCLQKKTFGCENVTHLYHAITCRISMETRC